MPVNSFLRISYKRKRLLKWKGIGTNRIDMKLDRNSSNVMNIQLEEKAGVKKNYVEIEPIEGDLKRSQFSNIMMDQINKSHETIFSINNPNI
jgi:hypothetical protein